MRLNGWQRIAGSTAMRLIVVMIGLWAVSAWADDLPTNLLLKCEGKVLLLINFEGSRPRSDEGKFETMLRLKDGELSDTGSIWLTTKNCALRNGIIQCSAKSVANVTDPTVGGSSRREMKSYISRETGEYNLFVEDWSFAGANASGKQRGNTKLHRFGICRSISQPIF
jgi:hypothetical protein